jgi:hypothetical protein
MRPTATVAATANHTAAPHAAAIAKIASWMEHEQCCVTTQRVSQHWNVSRKRAAEWLEEVVSSNNNNDGKKKYRLTFCQHQQQLQQQQPNNNNKNEEDDEEEVPMTSECVLVDVLCCL